MLHVLGIIAPMFLLLGVGMAAGFSERFRSAQPGLNAFVFYFSLPAFIFVAVANAPLNDGVPLSFIMISLGVTALVFALAYAGAGLVYRLRKTPAENVQPGAFAIASTYGNVGYLGVPIVLSVLGPEAALGAALGQLLHNVLFMVGYPLLKTFGAQSRGRKGGSIARMLWNVAKKSIVFNPVVISVVAGVIVGLTEVRLPAVLSGSIEMLGQAAVPTAMFAVGLTIKPAWEGIRSRSVPPIGVALATIAKLGVLPLATLVAVLMLGDSLAPEWGAAAVIMAAMPISSTANIVVFEYDGDSRLVGASTLVTSVLAVATIPLIISLLG
ncbi:AEC family transporter [Microbacterium sp. NC79]|uniref:AEC family transporter n=1 Tax=Microbacterium sp. NC79 TaxID=2851009 RepID=UPI001C2BF46D|nr:AEC family transporter [Microbacterium sp. NC79]MBV0895771.1 AEC family transporter [Microbacterium sp. NC79]